jgi:hypothetical protein
MVSRAESDALLRRRPAIPDASWRDYRASFWDVPRACDSDWRNSAVGCTLVCMDLPDRVHVFEHTAGDWWAECLVCRAWVSTSNADERTAEQKAGRHLRNDHPIVDERPSPSP